MLAVALLALTACDKPAREGEASVITLATQTLSVKAEGGDYTVRYSIANPIEGEELKFDYDAEWLRSIVAEAGNIKISVDANEGEERTAEVVVGYKGAESITLSVKQEAAAPEAISVVIEELTGNSCITAVTPVDPEMYYVMYKSDLSYFLDNNLLTAEALFDDDMFYFKRGADYEGISLKSYMEQNKVLFQGTVRAAWPGIRPGEQSVIYAYGVKFNEAEDDCEMITSIAWKDYYWVDSELFVNRMEKELAIFRNYVAICLQGQVDEMQGFGKCVVVDISSHEYVSLGFENMPPTIEKRYHRLNHLYNNTFRI